MKTQRYYLLVCFAALFSSWGVAQQRPFQVDGSVVSRAWIDSLDGVILQYQLDGEFIHDTAQIVQTHFSFTGSVPAVMEASLIPLFKQEYRPEPAFHLNKYVRKIYVGDGNLSIIVDDSFRQSKATGSQKTAEYDLYQQYIAASVDKNEKVYQETREVPKEEAKIKRRAALSAIEDAKKGFLKEQPDNSFSLDVMNGMISKYQNKELFLPESDSLYNSLVSSFNRLSSRVREMPDGKDIQMRLDELKNRKLPAFSGELLDGGTLDIADYKGRIFLIDFWGSWCIWCRKGHPHLKEIYEKYKPLGFEIIGVGVEFDKDRSAGEKKLRKAIADDGIDWVQVYNENDGENDLRKVFSIYAYPTKILVDRSGNIVLRVYDDDERKLDAKLAELFSKDSH